MVTNSDRAVLLSAGTHHRRHLRPSHTSSTATNTLHRTYTHTPNISCYIPKPPQTALSNPVRRTTSTAVLPCRRRPTSARGYTATPNAAKSCIHLRRTASNTTQSLRATADASNATATPTPAYFGELGQGAESCTPASKRPSPQLRNVPCLLPVHLFAFYSRFITISCFLLRRRRSARLGVGSTSD